MAKVKKIDIKKEAKLKTLKQIQALFESQGITVLGHENFSGMTDTTMVVQLEDVDVQVKLITPSNKVGTRYIVEEVEED